MNHSKQVTSWFHRMWSIVKSSPLVVVVPLILFICLAGIGSWAVNWSAHLQTTWTVNQAQAIAKSTALAIELKLFVNIQPALVLALFVRQNPQWDIIHSQFSRLAKSIFVEASSQGFSNMLPITIRLAPFSVVADSMPTPDQFPFENGTNAFLDPLRRDALIRTVQLNTTTIAWISSALHPALYVRVPIFIGNTSQSELWGRDNDNSMREYCPPCYRPDLNQKLWGFTSVVMDPSNIMNGNFAELLELKNLNFVYKLYRSLTVDSNTPDVLIGQTANFDLSLADMMMQIVVVPNDSWFLFIAPVGGWIPQWVSGLHATVIIISFFAAMLLASVLISRYQYQILVHTLVPRSFAKRVEQNIASNDRKAYGTHQANTIADKVISMMVQLLKGEIPSLPDVILVRTAMIQSLNLHTPMNLEQRILESVKDTASAAALVYLVGLPITSELVVVEVDSVWGNVEGEILEGIDYILDIVGITNFSNTGITCDLESVLLTANSWAFDVFQLDVSSNGRPLSALAFYLLNKSGLIKRFNIPLDPLVNFLKNIEDGYRDKNPYHNRKHAADVLQSMHLILHDGIPGFVDHLTLLSCYIASIVHDYDHGGQTNDFLILTGDILAMRYNDKSPLENHHLSSALLKTKQPSMNFLVNVDLTDSRKFRKMLIDLVLATDMKQHFNVLSVFETQSQNPKTQDTNDEMQRLATLQMALKISDLGHLFAPLSVHIRWVEALEEECFLQGDIERASNLPISPLFDRMKPGMSRSQIGFFEVVVLPCFMSFSNVHSGCRPIIHAVRSNYEHWLAVSR